MSTPIPRIRGNAIQEGAHWTWEAYVTVGDHEEAIVIKSPNTFISKIAAINDMKKHAIEMAKLCGEAMGAGAPTAFMDMNKNEIVSAEEFTKATTFKSEGEK